MTRAIVPLLAAALLAFLPIVSEQACGQAPSWSAGGHWAGIPCDGPLIETRCGG
jgi:hypothetical protein